MAGALIISAEHYFFLKAFVKVKWELFVRFAIIFLLNATSHVEI